MKGLDAWSLPGAARWGGAGAESPRSATRLPLRGTSWGLWSSPRNRRRLRFPPGLFPLVYLLNPPSRLFGSKISTRPSNRTGVPASLLSHLEIRQQALFPEFSAANPEEKGSFSETESRSGDPGPRISGQDPLLASRPSLASQPAVSSRATRELELASLPPRPGLT